MNTPAIQPSEIASHPMVGPPTNIHVRPNEADTLIVEVAKAVLIEFGVAMLFSSITVIFVANPLAIFGIFAFTGSLVLFNTALRCALVYKMRQLCDLKSQQEAAPTPERKQQIMQMAEDVETWQAVVGIVCPFTFSIIDRNTKDLVTHEAGHALCAMAMYKNAHPKITITFDPPFNEGYTQWHNKDLTVLGQALGRDKAAIICSAGGTGLSLLVATTQLILANKYDKSHPEFSRYLIASAISSFIHHLIYALSALWESAKNRSHDFLQLWNAGIHPLLSASTIVAIPIVVRGILFACEKKESQTERVASVTI